MDRQVFYWTYVLTLLVLFNTVCDLQNPTLTIMYAPVAADIALLAATLIILTYVLVRRDEKLLGIALYVVVPILIYSLVFYPIFTAYAMAKYGITLQSTEYSLLLCFIVMGRVFSLVSLAIVAKLVGKVMSET